MDSADPHHPSASSPTNSISLPETSSSESIFDLVSFILQTKTESQPTSFFPLDPSIMSFISSSDSFIRAENGAASEHGTDAEATAVAGTPVIEDVYAAHAPAHAMMLTAPASSASGLHIHVSQAEGSFDSAGGTGNSSGGADKAVDIGAALDLVFQTASNNSSGSGSQSPACGQATSADSSSSLSQHMVLDSAAFPQLPQSPLTTTNPTVQPSCPSSALATENAFSMVPYSQSRVLRRHTQPAAKQSFTASSSSSASYRRSNSSTALTRAHPYVPSSTALTLSRRSNSSTALQASTHVQGRSTNKAKMLVIPSINHDGSIKRCSNCKQTDTPSWRRHPETQDLLCNACGLYLRLHRKSRPIAFDDDGNVQVIRKNAAIRREPVNLGNHHGQIYPGGNGYHSMQFSPLPLALMPGYQQRVPAQTHELQQQQQQQLQPGAPGPAVSFADIQAMAEPFSSLTLATSMAGSAVSVGPSFGYFTQLDGMLAGGQLDAHRLQTQGNVVGVQVQEMQDMHPAFSTPPQSSPGLPNVSPGLVDWYSRGQDQGQGHDYQGFGRAHQIPLALTNGAEPPDLSYGNGESSVSLTPESNPSSSGFSTI